MKRLTGLTALILILATNAALAAPKIEHPWIRWLPGDLPAAGYVMISNPGDKAVELTGATSEAYAKVMLHRSFHENGEAHMQMVSSITVPAHGHASLAPGGYHLMLMHAKHAIKPGQTVKIELQFSDGSKELIEFPVRPANAGG